MHDNSRAVAAVTVGVVLGGVAAYLIFTDQGRSWRRQIEPALEDIARELTGFRSTFQRASAAASEGWRLLDDALGEGGRGAPTPYSGTRQTSPF